MIPGLMPHDEARDAIIEIFESLSEHPIRTAEGFRNAILAYKFAINPMLDIESEDSVLFLMKIITDAVQEGRMIDFGFIPNALIKETSQRTREVFEAGELQQPYDSWLAVSAWEGGMCGYLFANDEEHHGILAIELYGVSIPGGTTTVMVNDFLSIDVTDGETFIQPGRMVAGKLDTEAEIKDRGANLLDPLVTFLRILSDASVPITDIPAPERLNKRRIKLGKSPIPPHTRVETKDYVSIFHTAVRRLRNEGKGFHHASPVPHWRRAHKRHLHDGKVIPVRSSKVNWREAEELHRLFTRVKP